jgi:hypothetical protein
MAVNRHHKDVDQLVLDTGSCCLEGTDHGMGLAADRLLVKRQVVPNTKKVAVGSLLLAVEHRAAVERRTQAEQGCDHTLLMAARLHTLVSRLAERGCMSEVGYTSR